ncbi:aminotransferase-like domain-containing protein [Oceanospirillum sediminis]|uniref:PLP-dependent aminotransferase family protein n=1 Tax=Oceanospirillum sediminis TaxID=2760088 RepID=A0A839IUI0_9GAMM|nr:PLP-dependent aminotransferase family protein [Oceanospirillum sediminis]MBB1487776.1 PLP-dependent aminotransferase family protein [Oceanospirillum sediminis]
MTTAKYQTIAASIRRMIDSGKYPAGSKLPPHRTLARELSTTPATIAKAYNLLADQEIIESFIGRGSFVCQNKTLDQVIHSGHEEQELNFSILQPCLDDVHLKTLNQHLHHALHNTLPLDLHCYAEASGLTAHKEAGEIWLQHYGLQTDQIENILLTNGAQHALSALIQFSTQPGDAIAVEAQTYPGLLSIIRLLGRRAIAIEMDEQGMLPEALQSACQTQHIAMAVLIPSHQNPTGITMPLSRREAIAGIIEQYKIWLLEDDIYSFLNPDIIPPITNLIPQQSFYVSSLSKALSPGLRCAYIKAPDSQSKALAQFIRASVWLPPPTVFAAAASLIHSGEAFQLANRQRDIAQQRQSVAEALLPGNAHFTNTGSYHIWLSLPADWSSEAFTRIAREHHILVSSAEFFNSSANNTGHTDKASLPRHNSDSECPAQTPNAIRLSLMAESQQCRFEQGIKELAALLKQQPMDYVSF